MAITIKGQEAYLFTAQTVTQITKHILENHWQKGFQTPATVYNVQIYKELQANIQINH